MREGGGLGERTVTCYHEIFGLLQARQNHSTMKRSSDKRIDQSMNLFNSEFDELTRELTTQ